MFLLAVITGFFLNSHAQFSKADLQATGLTCAMCNNAINKALLKLPYISTVHSDIRNSSFHIVFKEGQEADIDGIKKAVEDAGFSVGNLKLTGNFNELKVGKDAHVKVGNEVFHFLDTPDQVLNGEKTIQVVDKGFLTAKQYKKFSATSDMPCLHTGKSASCCLKDGISADTRIYHVTI